MSLRIIAGTFKNRLLKAPKGSSTRPTQSILREAVFNICQMQVPNSHFLDLFAGSGAMGIEALSRGATHATFVEQNKQAALCIKENITLLHLESQTKIIPQTALKALSLLEKSGAKFDLVYVDPPYDLPFDIETLVPLLTQDATIFIEGRYDPRKPYTPPTSPHFQFRQSRKFGVALLSIFDYIEKKGMEVL